MNVGKTRQRIRQILEEYQILVDRLLDLSRKKLLKGSFVKKYKACGKGKCKCTRGELHGPFFYLSLNVEGKTRMIFIRESEHSKARRYSGNYKDFRSTRAKIVNLHNELMALINQTEKSATIQIEDIREK